MSERQREKEEGEPFVLSTDEYLYIIFFVYIFYFLLYDVNDEDFSRKVFFFYIEHSWQRKCTFSTADKYSMINN